MPHDVVDQRAQQAVGGGGRAGHGRAANHWVCVALNVRVQGAETTLRDVRERVAHLHDDALEADVLQAHRTVPNDMVAITKPPSSQAATRTFRPLDVK